MSGRADATLLQWRDLVVLQEKSRRERSRLLQARFELGYGARAAGRQACVAGSIRVNMGSLRHE